MIKKYDDFKMSDIKFESKSENYQFISESAKELEFAYFDREDYDGGGFIKIYLDETNHCTQIIVDQPNLQDLEYGLNDYYFKIGEFIFYTSPAVDSERAAIIHLRNS